MSAEPEVEAMVKLAVDTYGRLDIMCALTSSIFDRLIHTLIILF